MTSVPLLPLPGLLCDDAVWTEVREHLVAPTLPTPDYGMADSIGAMADIALQDAPERFIAVGHSMGGRVALEIQRRAPQRLAGLALLDTGFRGRAAGEAGQRERENRHALLAKARQDGMRAMGGTWLQGMVHPERLDDETLVEAILAMIERKDPDTFAAQIDALLARPDATEQLAGIACPTLLLCGRQDAWSPLERHEEMAGLIPGSRLEVIEEAGHMSPMERPAAVARALDHWRNHA
ncbi:pimeloyl-ACP methyl ester carboxylesterase [Chromohalobacter marismortui]|uniref:Alpha/beta hydrolase n=2 Tax=Chromohalobacter TaxID=42054 RepID=Q1R0R9_CHRI1|nr:MULTISPECIES: alpha/beta fold hydrolase [Chromohalobacter]ABE57689.1 alpha/beta hydrolase [Chromohalobacter salexigens DSM 3043]MCI0509690.1 alpha/beta hydrolase [Chromohalobacter sp.]MCI0593347.1 alpha/beta hydrolase [Chromohalobacter sp.]MCT8468827.1 alpha/beta hydrolase [Chromohalobacter canadensis]MCT8472983.1 alpha/beta hydrolase [Chromohalobacter canadensis]